MMKRIAQAKETNADKLVNEAKRLHARLVNDPEWMKSAIKAVEGIRQEISDGRYLYDEAQKDLSKRTRLVKMMDASKELVDDAKKVLSGLGSGEKKLVLEWLNGQYPAVYGKGTPVGEGELLRPQFGKEIASVNDWIVLQDHETRFVRGGAWKYEKKVEK